MDDKVFSLVKESRELELLGYSRPKIARMHRAGKLLKLRRGVYIDAQEFKQLNPKERCLAGHLAVQRRFKDPVFSHLSAAFIWGAPLLRLPNRAYVSFARSYSTHHPDLTVYGGRAKELSNIYSLRGLTVTSPVQTVLDCARVLPAFDALCIADGLLKDRRCTRVELLPKLHAVTGRGSKNARILADCASEFSESPAESFAVLRFMEWDIERPEQQVEVVTALGYLYRPDFVWRKQRTILEVDGQKKYTGSYGSGGEKMVKDGFRQRELEEEGWTVVRTTWDELKNRPDRLRARLASHGIR